MRSFSSARKLHSQEMEKKKKEKKEFVKIRSVRKFVATTNWWNGNHERQKRDDHGFLIDKARDCLPEIIHNKQDKEN